VNELLQSIKADLLSRQMLPLLAAGALALVGALAYVALAGGGGESKPPAPVPAATASSGLPISIAPPDTTAAAAAETPAGVRYQTQGPTRDPFSSPVGVPTSGGTTAGASTAASTSTSTSNSTSGGTPGKGGASSGGGGGSPSKAGTAPASPPKVSPPSATGPVPKRSAPMPAPKPEIVPFYDVSALFGPAPANPGEPATLTPYEDMKRFEPLPAAKDARIVFAGVVSKDGRQRAVFGLVTPPILRGQASCFPSATHCQWIELGAGKSEELEYVSSNGEAVAFELKVVKIVKRSSPAGTGASRALQASMAGRRALIQAGLSPLGWAKPASEG
jgi:hypothetical protein